MEAKELLTELIEAVRTYDALRDMEWDFEEKYGHNRDLWDDEVIERHDTLLKDISNTQDTINTIFFEATGDKSVTL